ncbi:ribosome small subunit-dependent GTPase A [bacterium]|nr:ribosome small subunit-dependent GTPase A [bacterium]
MTSNKTDLTALGWSAFFSAQIKPDEQGATIPARVISVHRGALDVVGDGIEQRISVLGTDQGEAGATVGDWLLLSRDGLAVTRLLDRKSLFKRRAAGTDRQIQLIAANIDTIFIVTSCNADFNVARLERYLALARDAEVVPVIIITKADITKSADTFVQEATALLPGLIVKVLDARNYKTAECLAPWFGVGQTVALVGSSGVGKSTLVNTLMGNEHIATQSVRDDDDKGRHTTTVRTLYRLPGSSWVLDTPGMRSLQLTDIRAGLDEVFADIVTAAITCRFSDCQHDAEPGCSVKAAVDAGTLELERLERWRKLVAEDTFNNESLTERRIRERSSEKMTKDVPRRPPR